MLAVKKNSVLMKTCSYPLSTSLSKQKEIGHIFAQHLSILQHSNSRVLGIPTFTELGKSGNFGEATLGFSEAGFSYAYNSALPSSSYDDAPWKGVGSNLRADLGFEFDWKGLRIVLEGNFWYAQNQGFELIPAYDGRSEAHHYWAFRGGSIDSPQQFLGTNLLRYNLGQSALRYTSKYFTIGLSTENVWIGPARFFPLMMSNQGEGFPHADIGTPGFIPLVLDGIDFGAIEFRALLGLLYESDSFDNDDSNNYNQILGFTAGYAFPFQKNLTFGLHFYRRKNMLNFPNNFKQLFDFTNGGPTNTHIDKVDSQVSVTMNWAFPEVGVAVYGEYGRNDLALPHAAYTRIDHSNGYTLGMQKVFTLKKEQLLSVTAELTDLFQIPYNGASQPSWYKHFDVPQGHTHNGQYLGNPVGPGSDSQILRIDYFNKGAMYSLWFQRVLMDKDYFFHLTELYDLTPPHPDPPYGTNRHPYYPYTLLIIGTEYSQLLKQWKYFFRIEAQFHYNYGWWAKNDIANIRLEVGMSL